MAGVDPSPRWLLLAVAILAAFLGAVSMVVQELYGWSFIVLCALAGLLGGIGYRARDLVLPTWKRLPKAKRLVLVALTAAIILASRFVANRHKPNAQMADLMIGIGVLVALALVGLYRLTSHRLDSLHGRASRH
jgi:peptidoglycan/LPS O-acetylase OafA/YrhL